MIRQAATIKSCGKMNTTTSKTRFSKKVLRLTTWSIILPLRRGCIRLFACDYKWLAVSYWGKGVIWSHRSFQASAINNYYVFRISIWQPQWCLRVPTALYILRLYERMSRSVKASSNSRRRRCRFALRIIRGDCSFPFPALPSGPFYCFVDIY